MKVSMLAKSAAVALAFGLVTSTPAHAVDLSGSGASFPAQMIEECKVLLAQKGEHSLTYAALGSGAGRDGSDKQVGHIWFSDTAHTGSTARASLVHIPAAAAPIAAVVEIKIPGIKNQSGITPKNGLRPDNSVCCMSHAP